MTTQTSAGEQVAATARWTAAVRAQESARSDALYVDPWAAALAGEEGMRWLAARPQGGGLPMAIRTRYFDDWLVRVTGEAGIRQVVLMAAGLDTRAFRLVWPAQTRLVELDKAAVLHYTPTVIEADLTAVWTASLLVAGFAAQQPAVWLVEGFLFYLPVAQLVDILDALTGFAAPGSWLGYNIVNAAVLTSPWTRLWVEMQAAAGAPWLGTLEDPVAFLAERGLASTIIRQAVLDSMTMGNDLLHLC